MAKTVVVTIEGGVVQNVECPEGVAVIVRDYDVDETDGGLQVIDSDGNRFREMSWMGRQH